MTRVQRRARPPAYPRISPRWAPRPPSVEGHDGADRLSIAQSRKAVVDGVKPDASRDQLVEHQPPVQVGLRQQGEVARGTRLAVARAPDPLFLHQGAPAESKIGRASC